MKYKPIKREKLACVSCKEVIIKETWNHGGVYYFEDLGIALFSHRCKLIEVSQ